jgi:shikimate dehydrogenase
MNDIERPPYLVGIIGWPVAHSKSPDMHHAAAAALDLDLTYVALPVRASDLATAIKGLPALGFRGVNVTVPHKEAVIPLLDEVDPAARAIGAVNTIVVETTPSASGQLRGYNTDWAGFLADLADLGLDLAGHHCFVLGAGGSARAVVYGLARAGGRVHIFARRPEQARKVIADLAPLFPAARLQAHDWSELSDRVAQRPAGLLIVNTTPLGMWPKTGESPWPSNLDFPPEAFVYDLVYNPAETRLIYQARAAGCRTANGLGMLLHQGAQAFQLWTGLVPDLQQMASAIH